MGLLRVFGPRAELDITKRGFPMNDLGINLKGKTVIVRNPIGTKKKFSIKERTFKITGGSGCIPDVAYSRKLNGQWLDGTKDTIDSFNIESVKGEQ